MSGSTFTGIQRRRKTTWRVRTGDALARVFITMGGIGTIVAVCGVCVFLVWVVIPLFLHAEIRPGRGADSPELARAPRRISVDEYRVMAWSLDPDGTIVLGRADTGEPLDRVDVFAGDVPSAVAPPVVGSDFAFGYPDGRVRFGTVGFRTRFLDEEPAGLASLERGGRATFGKEVVERTLEGQLRVQGLHVELQEPFSLGTGTAVRLLDRVERSAGPMIAAVTADGTLRVQAVRVVKNMMTGKVRTTLTGGAVAIPDFASRGLPRDVFVGSGGTMVSLLWEDGRLLRVDTRDLDAVAVAEEIDLVPEAGRTVSAAGLMIGRTTLVVGDSLGRVRAWFAVRPESGAAPADGLTLVPTHELRASGPPMTAFAASARSRMVAAGFADGTVDVYHVTSSRLLGSVSTGTGRPVGAVTLTPKDDGIVAASAGHLHGWDLRAPHPETTAASIFGKVWYEGSARPEHVWQSSSGTDDFEPKYGLMPLVFGTLKATLYSMLFGTPIALLAAVFTSEFLDPKWRARVKPTIELMASLPSVVLGFLSAIILAPFIEGRVPETLALFATLPFTLLAAAHLWQLLPRAAAARFETWRLAAMLACIPVAVLLAAALGPAVERVLFGGDLKAWLDGQVGGSAAGWIFALLPLSALGVAVAVARWIGPALDARFPGATRPMLARLGLAKFLAGTVAAVALAVAGGFALGALGADARGVYLGTYVQRNAMVVGFVMGFAVIPIIYTLAEDALSAVPEHLRAASLAVGATRWQTALLVILPTAMSGLFSAVMIGLGRAVGETMIVLMAAGNTPVMEWNLFNGFRTLSANIAVELPEAVQNGTNYRMLFLAALVLFAVTFVLNTVAESVRLRFRRRAFEL